MKTRTKKSRNKKVQFAISTVGDNRQSLRPRTRQPLFLFPSAPRYTGKRLRSENALPDNRAGKKNKPHTNTFRIPRTEEMPLWEDTFVNSINTWSKERRQEGAAIIKLHQQRFIYIYCTAFLLHRSVLLHDALYNSILKPQICRLLFHSLWQLEQNQQKPWLYYGNQLDAIFPIFYDTARLHPRTNRATPPDFKALSRSKSRRKLMALLWVFCGGHVNLDELRQALTALRHQYNSREITGCLNRLLYHMNAGQIGIAQIFIFYLYQQYPEDFQDKAAYNFNYFRSILKTDEARRNLATHDAFFEPFLEKLDRTYRHSRLSVLAANRQTLREWSIKSPDTYNLKSIDDVCHWALNANRSEKRKYARLLASEMVQVTNCYYQDIPLTEFCTADRSQQPATNAMSDYFNKMHNYLTSFVVQQPKEKVGDALSFVIKTGQAIYNDKALQSIIDLTSLMLIYLVIEHHSISRLDNTIVHLSEQEHNFIETLRQLLSPADNFKNIRQFDIEHNKIVLPNIGMFTHDMQFAKDGNRKDGDKLINQGVILQKMEHIRNQLQYIEPRSFNTDINRRMVNYEPVSEQQLHEASRQLQPAKANTDSTSHKKRRSWPSLRIRHPSVGKKSLFHRPRSTSESSQASTQMAGSIVHHNQQF